MRQLIKFVSLPLPEAPSGTAAGQKGSLFRALDELPGEARKQASAVYTGAVRATDRFVDFQYTLARHNLSRVSQRLIESNTRDEKDREARIEYERKLQRDYLVRIEAGLGRKLRPSERLIATDMRGQPVESIISTIASLK